MFDKLWKIIVGTLVLGLVVGGIVYLVQREPKREMTPLMHQLAVEVNKDVATKLPRHRDINTVLLLVVGRGHREEEAQFKDLLQEAIIDSDKYRVKTWKQAEKAMEGKVFIKLAQKLGMTPGDEITTIEQAKEAIPFLEHANFMVEGVLLVRVTNFSEGPDKDGLGAKVGVECQLWSRAKDKTVETLGPLQKTIESPWDLRYLRHRMKENSIFWRFPVWLLACLGLPWALIQLVRKVVKLRNNGANISMLITFTVIDVALAWVLLMAYGLTWGTAIGLFFVFLMMGYYNYDACDYIERKLL